MMLSLIKPQEEAESRGSQRTKTFSNRTAQPFSKRISASKAQDNKVSSWKSLSERLSKYSHNITITTQAKCAITKESNKSFWRPKALQSAGATCIWDQFKAFKATASVC